MHCLYEFCVQAWLTLTEHVELFDCEPDVTLIVAVFVPELENEVPQVAELPVQAPDQE